MTPATEWSITITLRSSSPANVEWVRRALVPEIAREVPRASATLGTADPHELTVEVTARDTGSARAALNTYLGWIHLAGETARRAEEARHRPPAP